MASGATADLKRGQSSYWIAPEELVVIGVDTPHKGGEHALLRTKGEEERLRAPLVPAMTTSIMHVGVRMTVFVRRNGDHFEVVDGRRRVLHARAANVLLREQKKDPIQVRFEVKQGTDDQIFAMSRLDNRHHMDESPLLTAEAAALMIDKMDEETAAAHLGIGVPMLRIYLSLNDLVPEVRSAIVNGVEISPGVHAQLSPTAAAKLAKLPREEQLPALQEMVKAKDLSVANAAATRATFRAKREKPTSGTRTPAPQKRVLTKLVDNASDLEVDVTPDFWAGVNFALGRLNPKQIKGMTTAIRAVSTAKSKKVAQPS